MQKPVNGLSDAINCAAENNNISELVVPVTVAGSLSNDILAEIQKFSVVPVAGNIIGAGVGMLAGYIIDWAANEDFIAGKSAVDWTKEGAGWVADRVVDGGKWIGDVAVDVWDTATDYAEVAGNWIADTASDAWNTTTDFFEDTGDAIGGFFSGLFAY